MQTDMSLPAWMYYDPGFFELEREALFRTTWQLVCHLNDVPEPGDYMTLDLMGERALVLRGTDGEVRAFHNVCRHRAFKLADGQGNCGMRLTCPYHAWAYELDGALRGAPKWQGFEDLDKAANSLVPLGMEIWRGFVFVRFAQPGAGAATVAEMTAPYDAEIAPHAFEDLVPQGRVTLRPRSVNWKNVSDNYSDALHIPVAHPGLTRLFGSSYAIEAKDWVDKMSGRIVERTSTNWSERAYQKLLPHFDHLDAEQARTWNYYKLWPNVAFDVYADQVDFMQFIPVSPTETLIREIAYVRPDERREAKAARYLNWRINRQVNAEDTTLIDRVQQGMMSSSYVSGPLATSEVGLSAFARRLRQAIPEASLNQPPQTISPTRVA